MGITTGIVTPVGDLKWVNIEGVGKDNINKDGKVYTATLILETGSESEIALVEDIASFWEKNNPNTRQKKPKSTGYKPETDRDENGDDIETGYTAFMFKTNTTFPGGSKSIIPVLNYKGDNAPLQGKRVGNGSRGVIHGTAAIYNYKGMYGVSLYLKAVQLTKLVIFGGVDAEVIELEDGEEGYTGEEYEGEDTTQVDPASRPSL